MVKRKFAFSLAEALVSMIIIMVVTTCMLPVLTRLKSGAGLNPAKMKGAFACYWDGNALLQRTCNERQCDFPQDRTSAGYCEFAGIMRAASFYVIFTGGGGSISSAQVKTIKFPYSGDVIVLKPGFIYQPTTVYSSGEDVALPGYSSDNADAAYHNIESCQILSRGCPSGYECIDEREAVSCKVAQGELIIEGCECDTYDGHISEASNIPLSQLTPDLTDNNSKLNYIKSSLSGGSVNKYCYNGLCFNLTLKDSTLDANTTTSHFTEILASMNALRQSALVSDLLQLQPGAKGKPGAAVIMW